MPVVRLPDRSRRPRLPADELTVSDRRIRSTTTSTTTSMTTTRRRWTTTRRAASRCDRRSVASPRRDRDRGPDALEQQRHVPRPRRRRRSIACQAIYKPMRGERPLWDFEPGLHRREVATYLLSEHLGLGVSRRRCCATARSARVRSSGSSTADHSSTTSRSTRPIRTCTTGCGRWPLLDVLANNTDRKSGHVLLIPDATANRRPCGASTTGCASPPTSSCAPSSGSSAARRSPTPWLERVGTLCERAPLDVAALLADDEVEALQRAGRLVRRASPVPDGPDRPPLPLAAGLTVAARPAMTHSTTLIHRADLDGLVRMIDDRCSARDWPGLLRVRDRSRHAVEHRPPALAGGHARRVPLGAAGHPGARRRRARRDRRAVRPVHDRTAHRGRRPAPHVGRAAFRARPRARVPRSSPTSGCCAASGSRPTTCPTCSTCRSSCTTGNRTIRWRCTPTTAPSSRCPISPTAGSTSHPCAVRCSTTTSTSPCASSSSRG